VASNKTSTNNYNTNYTNVHKQQYTTIYRNYTNYTYTETQVN